MTKQTKIKKTTTTQFFWKAV